MKKKSSTQLAARYSGLDFLSFHNLVSSMTTSVVPRILISSRYFHTKAIEKRMLSIFNKSIYKIFVFSVSSLDFPFAH